MKTYGFKFVHRYKVKNFDAVCTSPRQFVRVSDPKAILNLWESHANQCNIVIGRALMKHNIPYDTDMYTPHIKKRKLKFPTKDAILYFKKSDGTVQLVKEWYNSKDHSLKSLAEIFNNNINHYLGLRIN